MPSFGGVAPLIANLVKAKHGYKYHWAVADYLQRAARHIASRVDVEQAYALGRAAVEMALAGKNATMPVIVRKSDEPYEWEVGEASLAEVANVEKKMPREFIGSNGFSITAECRRYLQPLIQGEDYPPYEERPAALRAPQERGGGEETRTLFLELRRRVGISRRDSRISTPKRCAAFPIPIAGNGAGFREHFRRARLHPTVRCAISRKAQVERSRPRPPQ